MKYFLVLVTAILGITATVYLVKKPLDHYATPLPQQTLDEWRVKFEYQKKQLEFLNNWKNCANAGGYLYIEDDGRSACMLRKDRWNSSS